MSEDASGGRLLVIAALVTGLLAGAGVFVWWMHARPAPAAVVQSSLPEPSAAVAPVPVAAPAPAQAPVEKSLHRQRHRERPVTHPPPEPDPPVAVVPASEIQASPAIPHNENKRKAVQETDGLAGPMSPGPALPEQPQEPVSPPAARPVKYSGPLSGVATWTGKLEKGQVLTITGSTPSLGSFSGAGLPGVPVRIKVDQTNLGFAAMPNASNGYRTVAFNSHAKHNRITIHWDIIQ